MSLNMHYQCYPDDEGLAEFSAPWLCTGHPQHKGYQLTITYVTLEDFEDGKPQKDQKSDYV